ncbi:uncharacterized protein VTP21DRAFT_234 [Calcarisporiella thermophila]|uniref:uncharacterized protein n=1 Tax=Calcarisporiella thermophila TaxID=911321 RepID=UPI003742694D
MARKFGKRSSPYIIKDGRRIRLRAGMPKGSLDHVDIDDDVETLKVYPLTKEERLVFISPKSQRRVTEFQFKVYDLCSQVPRGGSPRAVGQALRNNPFAPLPVPCHRVISSDFYLGGFDGEWGEGGPCGFVNAKRAKLLKEGLQFSEDGYLQEEMQKTRVFKDFKPV